MSTVGLPRAGEITGLTIPDLDSGLAYLARLPLANPLQAEVALQQFFDSLLLNPPPALTYLSLLEHTRVPLCFVEEELARRFINKPLPLGDVEELAFQQVVATWRKVTRAYAQCAQLEADAGDPEHLLRVALILHRCIHYTAMIIIEHYRAHRELPAGIWMDLHGYYASAEEWGVATYPLADALDPMGRSTHCAAAYIAALLMDLAGPYSLSVRDQIIIRRWSAHWAPLVEVVRPESGESPPPFMIDLMQDASLKPFAECLSIDSVRRLNTSRLSGALAQVQQQLAQRLSPSQIGLGEDCTTGQCRRLLDVVSRPWTHARAVRKFKRHACSGSALVGCGFDSMHFLVSGEAFSQPESMRLYSRGEFDKLFSFRQMADPTTRLSINEDRNLSRPDEWTVINQSANGFRLARSIAGQSVSHEQLVAVCPHDGARYFLAKLNWLMQARGGGLIAGISALPGIPKAVAARPAPGLAGHQELYSRAFLLEAIPSANVEASLVLPQGWFKADKVIDVFTDQAVRLRLRQVLQDGVDFERVSFEPAD